MPSLDIRVSALLAAACFGTALPACESYPGLPSAPASAEQPQPSEGSGSLQLALDLGSSHFNSVSYSITGNQFNKTGALNVSSSNTVSGTIGAIPFGTGYTLSLTAKSSSVPELDCDGSATFDVVGQDVLTVPVHLLCKEQPLAQAAQAPVPPLASVALGLALLGLGAGLVSRRRVEPPPA